MDADRPKKMGGRVMCRAVIATRCRVDDCLAESREILTRPRVPPRVAKITPIAA
ncbi:MAG: hypothetical protein PHF56_12775 [Desulfuromonadaceae bacterium]|nr:hypothetical protein [Desulfuromonadaceae bacterium]